MLIYNFYRLLKFPMRQIIGYFEDLWQGKNFDIIVPSFGHLSDLFASFELEVKHYCHKLVRKLEEGCFINFRQHWYIVLIMLVVGTKKNTINLVKTSPGVNYIFQLMRRWSILPADIRIAAFSDISGNIPVLEFNADFNHQEIVA